MIVNEKRLWIDAHIHVYADMSGGTPVFDIEGVMAVMDADDAHLVWLPSLSRPDYGQLNARPADYVALVNEAQLDLIERVPEGRMFGSISVHPGAVRESLAAIDLYGGEHGFAQVGEVLGYALGFELDTPEMVEIARHAARHDLPLECHCSTTGQPFGNQIRQTINLARQVPEAKIVAAHAIGGGNSWLHITAAQIYRDFGGENLWLEIRDFNTPEFLAAAVERVGSDRLIAGTDWIGRSGQPLAPYGFLFGVKPEEMPYACSVASLEGFLREAGCTATDVDRIAAGNSIELFGLADRLVL